MILPRFESSTGGGRLSVREVAAAIGAFVLLDSHVPMDTDRPDDAKRASWERSTGGSLIRVSQDGREDVYRLTHDGHEFRVVVMWGMNWLTSQKQIASIHFDYIREV